MAPTYKMNVVYVIAASPFCHKIGFTTNVTSRLAALQTASMCKLELVELIANTAASILEKRVHAALADYRLSGEWFAVSAEQAVRTIHSLIALAPRHCFEIGDMVRCISTPDDCPTPHPQVGKLYTVEWVYPGWQIDLAFLKNEKAAFDPTHFVRPSACYIHGEDVV